MLKLDQFYRYFYKEFANLLFWFMKKIIYFKFINYLTSASGYVIKD